MDKEERYAHESPKNTKFFDTIPMINTSDEMLGYPIENIRPDGGHAELPRDRRDGPHNGNDRR